MSNVTAHLAGDEPLLLDYFDRSPVVRIRMEIADPPSTVFRTLIEPAHVNRVPSANLARLRATNAIAAGGRFGEYGLILVRAPSIDSAQAFFAPDSTVARGVFKLALAPWNTIYEGTVTCP